MFWWYVQWQCLQKLLTKESLTILKKSGCPVQFVNAFTAFSVVVESCYGKDLLPNYKEAISQFQSKYNQLNISVTPKIHAVFYHIIDFCDRRHLGLGWWSEQSCESVHHDFKQTWDRYSVSFTNSRYHEQLLKAVKDYCSKHL